ncbi:SGNH/GDSL hydrolase family protein [Streptomyces katsurahamanus]|uniref:SGNH/GDSL hydrolase family protein n=1 Tax=Streptomyces katsurahamanus TaxID=2577098 RepID=A0ABW9NRA0_9ACTN|nr:SGNH/GDSL hydrolase family protein [Streptomyces katsurahamanus]MQS35853.1 SGNH/GDSL hydrolase family protein [Streptomyces katsurahamanus]
MRIRRSLAVLATAATLMGTLIGGSAGASAEPVGADRAALTYYVSLGDSLASGFQPDVQRDTDQSYTDKLFAQLKKTDANLRHIKLGCTGETTATMIKRGPCSYQDSAGRTVSQLDKAVDFLKVNGVQVKFLTLNIGGNDLGVCFQAGAIDVNCSLQALKTVDTNVGRITSAINAASSTQTHLAGANSFNPFLVTFLAGAQGKETALQSAGGQQAFNEIVAKHYKANHFTLVDFAAAYSSFAFTPDVDVAGLGKVPTNVARLCQFTFVCGALQDIHPNPAGHQVFADTARPAL